MNKIYNLVEQNINKTEDYINPSIGKIGVMYYDSFNDRVKFFSTEICDSVDSIDRLIEDGKRMMSQFKATRLHAKFFLRNGYACNRNLEARIPLDNRNGGIDLLFVGINSHSRVDHPNVLKAEDNLLSRVVERKPNLKNQISGRYKIQRLKISEISRQDITSMVELYQEAFSEYVSELNESNVRDMIKNSIVYGVKEKNTNQIVSTVVGEIAAIPTSVRNFKICELSEMATKKEHRGRGLVTYAAKILIKDIINSVDLIYAGARACNGAVNRSFFNLGFSYAGRLNKQCRISGDYDVLECGPYANINIWYMLPSKKEG